MVLLVEVGEDFRIEIPEEARKKLGLKPGDKLLVKVEGASMILCKQADLLKFAGCWRGYPEDLRAFMRELREMWSTWKPEARELSA